MAKCRVVVRPTGLINGREWPEVGDIIDLPKAVADGMAAAGTVELIVVEKKAEKRPASQAGVEKRAEKKSDSKQD